MLLRSTISVELHVQRFLEHKYGVPMPMQSNDHIGKYFFALAENQNNNYDLNILKSKLKPYPGELQIVISETFFLRNGLLLTETAIRDFNNYVSDHIFELLFTTLNFSLVFTPNGGFRFDKAIFTFCQIHGLNEEVFTYERAKKAWYRYRKANNMLIKSKIKKVSPNVP